MLTWVPCPSIHNTLEPCHWSQPLEVNHQIIPIHNYTIIDEVNCTIIGVTGNHHPPSENWPGMVGGRRNYSHPVHSPRKTSKRGTAIWTCYEWKNQQSEPHKDEPSLTQHVHMFRYTDCPTHAKFHKCNSLAFLCHIDSPSLDWQRSRLVQNITSCTVAVQDMKFYYTWIYTKASALP